MTSRARRAKGELYRIIGRGKGTMRRAHHFIQMHVRTVGTPSDAFASDASAHPTNAAQLSNLTAARQICGNIYANPWRPQHRSPSRIRREKAGSCRMKKTRRGFAFGSSQRNRMTLMFGAARFCEQRLNASRCFGFRTTPRDVRAAPRRLMRHNSFKQRWISARASSRVA
jgi:hypothetical protein